MSGPVLDVWVLRNADSERLTRIFVASVVTLITLGNIMMGCEVSFVVFFKCLTEQYQINLDVVLETIRKPSAPVVGLLAQLVIMPLVRIYKYFLD